MSLTKTVVNRPTTIIVVFLLILGIGGYIVSDIAIDLYPDINPPILVVITDYSDAGPEEVEKRITRFLEGLLSNVSGVLDISSTTSQGSSLLIMEFDWGSDIAEAANEVRDRLEFARDILPEDAGSPQIIKFDPSILPVMQLAVRGERSADDLRELAEDIVQPRLEQIEGVALASVSGGREKIIEISVPLNRLEAYGLTLTQIAGAIASQNIQTGGGVITEGDTDLIVQTAGEYESIEDIMDTVVSYKPGSAGLVPVRVRDIGDVIRGYSNTQDTVIINGEAGVYVSLQKQSGTNSVDAVDRVMERIPEIEQALPPGLELVVVSDNTTLIRSSISQVGSSALYGAVFAMLVLLLFLRNFKSTIIIGISIPVSLLITMMAMYFAGLTLNLLTLTGLVLGIGMIVDSSIVILENIYRYRQKGAKLKPAAILGSQEMITAITASILTTICVFLPVIMFQSQLDFIGVMFKDLAFTVVISLLSSLFVAMFLVPVLASKYLPLFSRKQKPLKSKFFKFADRIFERIFEGVEGAYQSMLRFTLNHKLLTIGIILAVLAFSLTMIPSVGFELLPTAEEDSIVLEVELPVGTTLSVTEDVMSQLQYIAETEVVDYQNLIVTAGSSGMFFMGSSQANAGQITITLPPFEQRSVSSEEVKEIFRSHADDFPDVRFSYGSTQPTAMGSTNPIDILVRSEDLAQGKETALLIRDLLDERVPEALEPEVSVNDGLPQIELVIDRNRAYSLGLNVYTIGSEISANIDGRRATIFREGGNEYDVKVILAEEDRTSLPDLSRVFVINSMGNKIPVSSFATLKESTGPVDINRENQSRVIHVTAGIKPGVSTTVIEKKIQSILDAELVKEDGVFIEYSGDYAELVSYGQKFAIIMIIAIALVFGVMAAQFEDFKDPFIIFFTIPLMVIGVIFIYFLTGTQFSVFTAVGLVMLAGIVVNNGIVLVDYTNLLRQRGRTLREATLEAGKSRFRPVLMTSLTTILGLVPMAFSTGEGSDLVQPIGLTVVGGLTVTTLLTLFLVPVLYEIFNRKHREKKEKPTGQQLVPEDTAILAEESAT